MSAEHEFGVWRRQRRCPQRLPLPRHRRRPARRPPQALHDVSAGPSARRSRPASTSSPVIRMPASTKRSISSRGGFRTHRGLRGTLVQRLAAGSLGIGTPRRGGLAAGWWWAADAENPAVAVAHLDLAGDPGDAPGRLRADRDVGVTELGQSGLGAAGGRRGSTRIGQPDAAPAVTRVQPPRGYCA